MQGTIALRSRPLGLRAIMVALTLLASSVAVVASTAAPAAAATVPPLMRNGYRQPLMSMPTSSYEASYMANNCGYTTYGGYINDEDGVPQYHVGADFSGDVGDPVYAIDGGHVARVGGFGPGQGEVLFIRHLAGDGTYFTVLYGHIDTSLPDGAPVIAGDQIGTLFAHPNGAHLHMGITLLDPDDPSDNFPSGNWGNLPCGSWPSKNSFSYNPLPFLNDHPGRKWAGDIVQWDNASSPNTSWIVKIDTADNKAKRYWIPSTANFSCMLSIGYTDKGPQPASVLDSLPDTGNDASCPIQPPSGTDRLLDGQGLHLGQSLVSPSGDYRLTLRATGADRGILVLTGSSGNVVWTTGKYVGNYVKLYDDCQLVGRDTWGTGHWWPNTNVTVIGGCKLVVKDGYFGIWRISDNKQIWTSNGGRLV